MGLLTVRANAPARMSSTQPIRSFRDKTQLQNLASIKVSHAFKRYLSKKKEEDHFRARANNHLVFFSDELAPQWQHCQQ